MSEGVKAADSPRWCGICNGYGDHHTDRHDRMTAAPTGPEHAKIPGSEASHNGYLGECWCQRTTDDAWPCREARTGPEPRTDANGCPDQPHHGVDCPGDACRHAADDWRTDARESRPNDPRKDVVAQCTVDASCAPGDHTLSWPCEFALGGTT